LALRRLGVLASENATGARDDVAEKAATNRADRAERQPTKDRTEDATGCLLGLAAEL
jgi:hypothetical protein